MQKIVKAFVGLVATGPGLKILGKTISGISKAQTGISTAMSMFSSKLSVIPAGIGKLATITKDRLGGLTGAITQQFGSVGERLRKVFSKMGTVANAGVNKMASITKLALKLIGPAAILGLLVGGLGLLQQNFGEEINKMIEFATTKLPEIIQSFADKIIENIPILITAGMELLNNLINVIIINLPLIMEAGVNILMTLVNSITDNIDMIIEMTINLITTLLLVIIENLPTIIEGGLKLLVALVEGIVNNIDKIIDGIMNVLMVLIDVIVENLPMLIEAGIKILVALIEGLAKAVPKLIEYIPKIIEKIFKEFGEIDWGKLGKNIIDGLVKGLSAAKDLVIDSILTIGRNAIDSFKKLFGISSPSKVFAEFGINMNEGLAGGIEKSENIFKKSLQKVRDIADNSLDVNYTLAYQGAGIPNTIPQNIQNTSSRIVNININNFQNNRKQDVKELVDEISFYLNRKDIAGGRK